MDVIGERHSRTAAPGARSATTRIDVECIVFKGTPE